MLNLLKDFDQKKSDNFYPKFLNTLRSKYDPGGKICSQGAKCVNTPNLYTTDIEWFKQIPED